MQAVLIAPPEANYVRAYATYEYLGLGYLCSYLEKKGIPVDLFNCNCPTAPSLADVIQRIVHDPPAVVGISIPTMPNLPGAIHAIQQLRGKGFRGHITIGGHVPTFDDEELLRLEPGLDSVVRGEGEETLLELVNACREGANWTSIPGISYRGESEIVRTAPRTLFSDLDQLPFPKRALDNAEEKAISGVAEIASSRGCYGNCTFCSVFSFYEASPGRRYRYRSAQSVASEAVHLFASRGVQTFSFVDDNFLGPGKIGKQRALTIAQLMKQHIPDVTFNMSCRANDVDVRLFSELKRCGLVRVFLGIESGVDSVLTRFRKHVNVKQNLLAIRTLNELGIKWDMGFLIYDPGTTFEELQENVRFLRTNRLYQFNAATLLLNGMVVFPGTPVETQLRDEHRLERDTENGLRFAITEVDYDTSLKFFNYSYTLMDPRAELMRHMIDYSYHNLTALFEVLWPLVNGWERWLALMVENNAINAGVLEQALGVDAHAFHTVMHWLRHLGSLVMNLLEDMIDLVNRGKTQEDFERVFEQRVWGYVYKTNPGGMAEIVQKAEEFLQKQSVVVEINGQARAFPGLASRLTHRRDQVLPRHHNADITSSENAGLMQI
jgi:radical SAM superfamily enzyme YgiQ (UPF0313 family)